jgi:O-antigen/teichoic acid export membrane protein
LNQSDAFERFAGTSDIRQDLRSKSVRGAIFTAIAGGGDFFLRLVSIAVLARLLIPEHFGLIGMVMAVTAIAGLVGDLGLSTATIQRREIDHKQVTNLFWINVTLGALLALVLLAIAPAVSAFYRDPRLAPITMAFSITFLFGGLTVQHQALLARQMKQAQLSFVRLGSSAFGVVLAVLLAIRGYGYWALVWQEIARSFLNAVGTWLSCPWIPGLPCRRTNIEELVRLGRNLSLTYFLNALISNLDRFLIGRFFGAEPVGLFRQAQSLIVTPIEQLNAPIQSVSQPALSILQDDPVRYRRYYRKIVFIIGLVTMPLAALAVVYAEEITLLVLGEKWLGAAPLLRIFGVAAFIRPVLGMAGVVLITCGQSKKLLVFALIRNTILVTLTFVGIRWGAEGVAAAQLATTLVLTLPSLYYSFARSPVTVATFFAAIRTPLIASGVMVAALVVFRSLFPVMEVLATVSCGFVVGAVTYFAGCLLLPASRSELNDLLKAIEASLARKGISVSAKSIPAIATAARLQSRRPDSVSTS